MKQLMIDLETMGVAPSAVILSLGAVLFDKSGVLEEKSYTFDFVEQQRMGRTVDPNTMLWWMEQGDAARSIISRSVKAGSSIKNFAIEFSAWVKNQGDLEVWSNGASFDVVLLEHLFYQLRMPVPWKFWNIRCYRTLKAFHPIERNQIREGVKHDALCDARFQAKCVISHLQSLTCLT